ncbi:MAG: gamma-glutamyl-gamma-aminobutyrate hydrolase family protein [Anaerolineae bacterium]
MSKPIIGVTTHTIRPEGVERLRWYGESIEMAGGEMRILAPDGPHRTLEGIDALLLSGGGDVHPRYYGQPMDGTEEDSIHLERDEMELHLIREALNRDMPIFAICRGIQVLNVAMGGGLIQHLGEGHRTPKGAYKHHLVRVAVGTRLASMLNHSGEISVNTYHHQGISAEVLAPGLRASAWALPDEWLIEAVESPEHRHVIGVQWHPERHREVPRAHQGLFRSLILAAAREPLVEP